MAPSRPLPLSEAYQDADEYVHDLLNFITTSKMLQNLCGGVHILDFMTRDPDLYSSVLPADWRQWLEDVQIMDFLELLMSDDLSTLPGGNQSQTDARGMTNSHQSTNWRGKTVPPVSLVDYIKSIRNLCLNRTFIPSSTPRRDGNGAFSRRLAVGMKPKKAHEVENFASFVNNLASDMAKGSEKPISHFVDFGSGQNYLGRVLASPLYQRQVIAVERKHLNVEGGKKMDVSAKISEKEVVWRNKKRWRATGVDDAEKERGDYVARSAGNLPESSGFQLPEAQITMPISTKGKILYVEHEIQDGRLDPVIVQLSNATDDGEAVALSNDWEKGNSLVPGDKNILCISLHSCGNLSHHGIRSLILNSFVKGVALVGCCYNLLTERLGSPTFKLPGLRSSNKRLEDTSSARDPHGFPMSEKMATFEHTGGRGIRLNITARMMAVQAPQNWTESEYEGFFTRHFYRALLQRLFLDRGFVKQPTAEKEGADAVSPASSSSGGEPIVLGSLRKSCYSSFVSYVRGAVEKLNENSVRASDLQACMDGLTDDDIAAYEQHFQHKRHQLCIVWSLMAFSAGVVESAIVTDRWLFLREQEQVRDCWVQTVFDYRQSPRNLVVVGLK